MFRRASRQSWQSWQSDLEAVVLPAATKEAIMGYDALIFDLSQRSDGCRGRYPELHNTIVDQNAARVGLCAQVHVPTGRICLLPYQHQGSCDFQAG